ncbi:MAG TPA: Gfo/Idh/MocA family oxidoreductase [Candidatus Limnocylindria bacterium]|nr:Gfo/Idh/MocA family oxidoreductase [Candidatus Limnocylindria bacterium]
MGNLRTAVIGTGFVGPFHVDAVRRGGYADVVALVGSNEGRTRERAVALGVAGATADLQTILADPSIDVVHVCTPNRTHVELATAVLEAGKHLVLEKPVALDLRSAREIADLARRRRRHAAAALTYRGYPMVRRARAIVASGELGPLRLVHGGYIQDWLAEATDYNWRLEPELGGASRAVADIGSHWFDTAEFISGLRIDAVFADLATVHERRTRPLEVVRAFEVAAGPTEDVEVRSEDLATILIRFEGGARGAAVISQVSPGRKNAFNLELAGSRATLDWDQEDAERLWIRTRAEARVLTRGPGDGPAPGPGIPTLPAGHPEGWAEALRDLLRPFYAAIAAGHDPPDADDDAAYPTLYAGARGVGFVEAVLESARRAAWVSIA